MQLSVISAPVIGGPLELNVNGPDKDGHQLDVLAVEDVPAPKILKAGLFLLLGFQRPAAGIRAMQWAGWKSVASILLVSRWTGSSTEAFRDSSRWWRGHFE